LNSDLSDRNDWQIKELPGFLPRYKNTASIGSNYNFEKYI